jgi:multicomponent Na+:H+ antiporter subunit A
MGAAGTVGAGLVGIFLPARLAAILAALVPAVLFWFLLDYLVVTSTGGIVEETVSWVPSLGIDIAFRIDGFALLFGFLITGIGTLVLIYAGGYFAKKAATDRTRFFVLILAFMLAMLGTVFSDNLIVLFVFWETTSLISFALIGFTGENRGARQAALQSLLITAGGGLALFAGILLIGIASGSYSLSALVANPEPVIESPWFPAIVALVALGAFTKSAQFPFHFWLPRAMAAPTPASAYLHSATMVKLGVFLLARLDPAFGATNLFSITLMAFGSLTMLVSIIQALRSQGFKAILAYSTVASLGTLVTLVGIRGVEAEVAVVGFLFAHALYKAALFFCAGIVIYATDRTRLRQVGGLAPKLPLTAAATVLASLSMAGLPFFVGYAAKDFLFTAKVLTDPVIWIVLVSFLTNVVLVAIAAVVTLRPFFKAPRNGDGAIVNQPGLFFVLPPLVLGTLGVAIGFFPLADQLLIEPAAAALGGGGVDVVLKVVPEFGVKLLVTLVITAAGLAIAWYWDPIHRVMRFNRVMRMASAERGYDRVIAGIFKLGELQTRVFQRGSVRAYTAAVVGITATAMAFGLSRYDAALFLSAFDEPVRPYLLIVFVVMGLSAVVAAVARSLLTSLLGVGLVGYTSAIIFLNNGAPDLAFTQFAVETLFLVIVMAVMLQLPLDRRLYRAPSGRPVDVTIAAVGGVTVTLALMAVKAVPFDPVVTEYFASASVPEAFGRNVVNVILVDFRALDTLGEVAVVAFAAIGCWALLRAARPAADRETHP